LTLWTGKPESGNCLRPERAEFARQRNVCVAPGSQGCSLGSQCALGNEASRVDVLGDLLRCDGGRPELPIMTPAARLAMVTAVAWSNPEASASGRSKAEAGIEANADQADSEADAKRQRGLLKPTGLFGNRSSVRDDPKPSRRLRNLTTRRDHRPDV